MNIPNVILITNKDYSNAKKLHKKQFIFKSFIKCLNDVINKKYKINGFIKKKVKNKIIPTTQAFYNTDQYHYAIENSKNIDRKCKNYVLAIKIISEKYYNENVTEVVNLIKNKQSTSIYLQL